VPHNEQEEIPTYFESLKKNLRTWVIVSVLVLQSFLMTVATLHVTAPRAINKWLGVAK